MITILADTSALVSLEIKNSIYIESERIMSEGSHDQYSRSHI